MNSLFIPLMLTIFASLSFLAPAQELQKVTDVNFSYWRAFHGEIQLHVYIREDPPKTILAYHYFKPNKFNEIPKFSTEEELVDLTPEDIERIRTFANDLENRAKFAAHPHEPMLDGASLTLDVSQNSYSLRFTSQFAYAKSPKAHEKELGELFLWLLHKTKARIPPDELY